MDASIPLAGRAGSPVLRYGERPAVLVDGIRHRSVAGAAQGMTALEVWDELLSAGSETAVHRHGADEVVVVLTGRGELVIDGLVHAFAAPCALAIPTGALHQIRNAGTTPMRLVVAFAQTPVQTLDSGDRPMRLPWSP